MNKYCTLMILAAFFIVTGCQGTSMKSDMSDTMMENKMMDAPMDTKQMPMNKDMESSTMKDSM